MRRMCLGAVGLDLLASYLVAQRRRGNRGTANRLDGHSLAKPGEWMATSPHEAGAHLADLGDAEFEPEMPPEPPSALSAPPPP